MRLAQQGRFVAPAILLGLMLPLGGCSRNPAPPTEPEATPANRSAPEKQVAPDTLLENAVQLLQASKRSDTAHRIAAQRLNQYLAKVRSSGDSPVGPLNANIKSALAGRLTPLQFQLIESEQFDRVDSIHVEGCFLLRDAAKQAIAGKQDNMSKALAIFDWVIRNVQIVRLDESAPVPLPPPVTVVLGRGNEAERAWTFMELLRQAEIESALLAYIEKSPDGRQTLLVPWIPAALWDDSLYLFDTTLGLPVPGPEDQPVATFRQLITQPSLLDQLSPDADHSYRLKPEQLQHVLALLDSTPMYWAPRMRFLQDHLPAEKHAVLWSDLIGLADRVRHATSNDTPQDLWALPKAVHELNHTKEYTEKILGNRENPLAILTPYRFFSCYGARALHLEGNWTEAIQLYLSNRIPFEQWITADQNKAGIRALLQHAAGPEAKNQEVMQEVYVKVISNARGLYDSIREDCTYFLGTLKFEQHDYKAATNWMGKSYIEKYPNGRWISGAHYHLGRCAEAQHNIEKAIEYYTMQDSSPQAAGNLIRAQRLGWNGNESAPRKGVTDDTRRAEE